MKQLLSRVLAARLTGVALLAIFALTSATGLGFIHAQNNPSVPLATGTQAHPDLSGFWEVVYNQRHFTPADLTSAAKARDKKIADEIASGRVIAYASRWCNFLGMPFIMEQSPPINIVQTADEIGIFHEQNSAPRHIYLDGRPHPTARTFKPTTNGHSVGHWVGDVLVVDTTNFSAEGHPEIPGGGYRGIHSHLVERFQLLDSQHLRITFTWYDPTVFVKPHTYYIIYHKLPPDTYALEDVCDASDAAPYVHSGGIQDPPDQ